MRLLQLDDGEASALAECLACYLDDLGIVDAATDQGADVQRLAGIADQLREGPDPTGPGLDDAAADALGLRLAELLKLRRSPVNRSRFDTSVGDKTPAGLARTVVRVLCDPSFPMPARDARRTA